ncbi:hypothetical protein EYF80_005687 [Liparis tanakae]|uniref:Uncharacterized protein n=1 Tax=Liparis tanakae TaxID=230148 RepID=A0A4Z2J2A2_9TELE|nr:hypothetical protein EYF80_005687 [Liparis tanakae]
MNTAIVDSITGQQLGSQSPGKVPCYGLRAEPWQAGNHNHTNIVAIVKQRQWDRGEKAALPNRVPGLLTDPKECKGLEAQADEDLGQHREQQRP